MGITTDRAYQSNTGAGEKTEESVEPGAVYSQSDGAHTYHQLPLYYISFSLFGPRATTGTLTVPLSLLCTVYYRRPNPCSVPLATQMTGEIDRDARGLLGNVRAGRATMLLQLKDFEVIWFQCLICRFWTDCGSELKSSSNGFRCGPRYR